MTDTAPFLCKNIHVQSTPSMYNVQCSMILAYKAMSQGSNVNYTQTGMWLLKNCLTQLWSISDPPPPSPGNSLYARALMPWSNANANCIWLFINWVTQFGVFLKHYLHKVSLNSFLVADENMGLCLYLLTVCM